MAFLTVDGKNVFFSRLTVRFLDARRLTVNPIETLNKASAVRECGLNMFGQRLREFACQ